MKTRIQSNNFGTERAVRFQMLEKVYNYATHIHQYAELAIPLSGALEITVENRTQRLAPGQAAFVSPFQPHSYKSSEINKLAIFVFSPSMLPDLFNKTHGKVGKATVFTPKQSTLALFEERIFDREDFDLFEIKGILYLTLSDYLCATELYENSVDGTLSAEIVAYISEHITNEITLGALSKTLGYNQNYLSGRIKEIFGINLCTLIASIRADKAKYLLIETDKTGLEICYECGFGSERSFHRQFKTITGFTPKEYRSGLIYNKVNYGVIKYFE